MLSLFFSIFTHPCLGSQFLAGELVRKSDDLLRGDTLHGTYSMNVATPNWTRKLKLNVWSKGRDAFFIRILEPAKEQGIGTLRLKNNMWNYLPNIERTIKIPPSLMLQPWMGSDFTNDDLVKESSVVHDYTHTIIDEKTINGNTVVIIELLPKPDAPVTWGKLILWIREIDFIPLRQEFYNQRGELIKVLTYSDVKIMNDRAIPTVWKIESFQDRGHATEIVVEEAFYNQYIDANIFTLQNLKKWP